jgi:hypothetical protein
VSDYLNEDQVDHIRALAAAPEKVCGCGWYWREECRRHCNSPAKQREEDKRCAD